MNAPSVANQFLNVVGSIDSYSGRAGFIAVPLTATAQGQVVTGLQTGEYTVEVEDCQGDVMARRAVTAPPLPPVGPCGEAGCPRLSREFSFSVAFGGHAAAMVARHNGAIIGYTVSSGHIPQIVITSPDGTKPLTGNFDLSWRCDACSGFALQWAYSGPIYGEAQHGELPPPWAMDSPISFNAYAFPAASSVHFTIVASDGFLEVSTDSVQLTMTGT